jgi:L,D-transpeptidase catalytic domain
VLARAAQMVGRPRPLTPARLGRRTRAGMTAAAACLAALMLATAPAADARAQEAVNVAMLPRATYGLADGAPPLPRLTYGRDVPLPRHQGYEAFKADLVVVFKGKRELHLMHRGGVIATYPVALGREPRGRKLHEGDGRTPEGVYVLDWRNPNSRFHRALHVSYPAPRDWERAARLGVHPGSDIMIHGLPIGRNPDALGHPYRDWTEGCIAVTSAEMDDIWYRVDDGTPIIIYP